MKVIVIGATGTIGKAVTKALSGKHTVVPVSHKSGSIVVDISDPNSIKRMYQSIGKVDAVVSAAGDARFAAFSALTDEDFAFSMKNKLMGQVNVVRYGFDYVADKGSFTLTAGTLSQKPMVGSAVISLVNGAIESFARAAALDMPRGLRVNAVSPGWVTETLKKMGMQTADGTPADKVATAYVKSVEESFTGSVILI